MSIIIRLQNLSLSAKSGDIRRFFGGLRIPNGGVHIVGGEKGDAFIAFTSDEDARIAMKRDGNKIKDTRVKLYLSSSMEMHQEIARITKKIPDDPLRKLSPNGSRSPQHFGDRSIEDNKRFKDYSPPRGRMVQRLSRRSPSLHRRSRSSRSSRSPKRSWSPRRSRSPRRRLKSPRRSRSPRTLSRRLSRSPDYRNSQSPYSRMSLSPVSQKSVSSRRSNQLNFLHTFHSSGHQRDASPFTDKFSNQDTYFDVDHSMTEDGSARNKGSYVSKEQVQLERKIAEALERGYALDTKNPKSEPFRNSSQFCDPVSSLNNVQNRIEEPYLNLDSSSHVQGQEYTNPTTSFSDGNITNNNLFPPFPHFSNNFNPGFGSSAAFPTSIPNNIVYPSLNAVPIPEVMPAMMLPPPPIPLGHAPPNLPVATIPPPHIQTDAGNLENKTICPGFYVTMSGLDPNWNFNDVQLMLRGIFIPQANIKWEVDDRGLKTGTAFLKLSNEDDFAQLLSNATYTYNKKLITVSECPDHVFQRYFLPDWPPKTNLDGLQSSNLYYRVKGLPYYSTYDSIVNFFKGLDVADMYIEFTKEGKASGLCWVSFKSMQDYHAALKLDGQQLGHRIVHFKTTTKEDMMKWKRKNGDLFYQSSVLSPANRKNKNPTDTVPSKPRRPLCAMLTGLSSDITPHKLLSFFKDSGLRPDAMHVTLNDQGRPCGRAFVEFSGFRDFDAALQFHGNTMDRNIICVKQVLYEEMSKILSSKRAMHFYGSSTSPVATNLPDKVPYLWQPPDSNRDISMQPQEVSPLQQDNYKGMSNTHDYYSERTNVQVFEYGNQSGRPSTVLTNVLQPPDFLKKDLQYELSIAGKRTGPKIMPEPFQEGKKFYSPDSEFGNKKLGRDIPVLSDREQTTRKHFNNHRDTTLIKIKKDTRAPVKFDVKIKQQVAKHTKVDDAFDKNSKCDPKKKLPRLSPEKKLPKLSPDEKTEIIKSNQIKIDKDAKNKSFERAVEPKLLPGAREKSDFKEKGKPQNEPKDPIIDRKNPKPNFIKNGKDIKNKSFAKVAEPRHFLPETRERKVFSGASKEKNDFKELDRKFINKRQDRIFDRREENYRRNFNFQRQHSPIRHDDYETREPHSSNERDYSSYKQAVVQICNVHPSIGSHEIKKFLCGYKINSEEIIRGYTDTQEPTGDVRVVFKSFHEAKMAVRSLDNHLLEGIPVTMFLVT